MLGQAGDGLADLVSPAWGCIAPVDLSHRVRLICLIGMLNSRRIVTGVSFRFGRCGVSSRRRCGSDRISGEAFTPCDSGRPSPCLARPGVVSLTVEHAVEHATRRTQTPLDLSHRVRTYLFDRHALIRGSNESSENAYFRSGSVPPCSHVII